MTLAGYVGANYRHYWPLAEGQAPPVQWSWTGAAVVVAVESIAFVLATGAVHIAGYPGIPAAAVGTLVWLVAFPFASAIADWYADVEYPEVAE